MVNIKSIEDVEVRGKKVLLRADFNVPLDRGRVRDDARIRAVLPTIENLLARGACLVIASHLGRPKGKPEPSLVLDPVAARLGELLNKPVQKMDMIVGEEVKQAIETMEQGSIILLENLRFEEGEEDNDEAFARLLADPVDIFVNDAFGTAHRAHASTVGVAAFIPAVAGLLMKKEIEELSRCLEHPRRPLTAILGGAKVSDKINVLRRFIQITDNLLVGGGMANTFLAARGYSLGDSYFEKGQLDEADFIMKESEKTGCRLVLPLDLVVTDDLETGGEVKSMEPEKIDGDWKAVDIGPKTAGEFGKYVASSAMIIWNGPLGVFEIPPFERGTAIIAKQVADSGAYSVIGGGDLVAAVETLNLTDRFSFISTGGGATLEFWEGRELPGIKALEVV